MNLDAARRTVSRMLEAVRLGDWGAAVNCVLVDWPDTVAPPDKDDAAFLGETLDGFRVDAYRVGAVTVGKEKAVAVVLFEIQDSGRWYRGACKLRRQNKHGVDAPKGAGRWGIDPATLTAHLKRVKQVST